MSSGESIISMTETKHFNMHNLSHIDQKLTVLFTSLISLDRAIY